MVTLSANLTTHSLTISPILTNVQHPRLSWLAFVDILMFT